MSAMSPLLLALTFCATALPAMAQSMTAQEFDAYTTGRTLTYTANGAPYGIEEYHKGHRVVWAFLGDDCVYGTWYVKPTPQGDRICFSYENNGGPQCWSFEKDAGGLIATFRSDPAAGELYEARISDKPMVCRGPKVGA